MERTPPRRSPRFAGDALMPDETLPVTDAQLNVDPEASSSSQMPLAAQARNIAAQLIHAGQEPPATQMPLAAQAQNIAAQIITAGQEPPATQKPAAAQAQNIAAQVILDAQELPVTHEPPATRELPVAQEPPIFQTPIAIQVQPALAQALLAAQAPRATQPSPSAQTVPSRASINTAQPMSIAEANQSALAVRVDAKPKEMSIDNLPSQVSQHENLILVLQKQIATLENKLMHAQLQVNEFILKTASPSSLPPTTTPVSAPANVMTYPSPAEENRSTKPTGAQTNVNNLANSTTPTNNSCAGLNYATNNNVAFLNTNTNVLQSTQAFLPRKLQDLPSFSGQPEEWPVFFTSFKQTTVAYKYTNLENHQRLQKCLTGVALDSVKSLLIFPDNVNAVVELLGSRFGRPEQLIRCQLSQVQLIKPITEDSLSLLIPFATKMRNLVCFLQAADGARHLANPILLDELIAKLPIGRKLEWAAYASQILPYPTIVHFSDWINQVASLLQSVLNEDVREPRRRVVLHTIENQRVQTIKCSICQGEHRVAECKRITDATVPERWDIIKRHRLCFTCLKFGHTTRFCRSKLRCPVVGCQKQHHELLHEVAMESNEMESQSVLNCATSQAASDHILFRVLPVTLYGQNKTIDTYALLDEGSSVTMLDSTLISELGLKGRQHQLGIQWVGGRTVQEPSVVVSLYVSGVGMKRKHILQNVHGVANLCLPTQTLSQGDLNYDKLQIGKLPPKPYYNVQPKLLIGLDHCHLGLPTSSVKLYETGPFAAKTELGWVVFGPTTKATNMAPQTCLTVKTTAEEALHNLVAEYFETENFGIKPSILVESEDDKRARSILDATTERINGRFQAGLLWSSDDIRLPDSYKMALRRLIGIERKMKRDKYFATAYTATIQEYVRKKYARRLLPEEARIENPRTWYLPHFAVVNINKPKKLRLVFDAAARVNNVSLNTYLLKGPQEQKLLPSVLFKFRQGVVAVCADIKQMFHQIAIRPEDRCAQRFLWREDDDRQPEVYEMMVMTFGAACSPCTAHYVMTRNALEHKHHHPRAIESITEHHYVDDFVDSFESEEEAIEISKQVRDIHADGGFELRNFTSNSIKVLRELDSSKSTISVSKERGFEAEKVLGMKWLPESDVFVFQLQLHPVNDEVVSGRKPPTKRELLSVIMSVFDPLGFLSHLMISAKLMMREVWRHDIRWDDTLPSEILVPWNTWRQQLLSELHMFSVPRSYFRNGQPINLQLHVFVDSSEDAFSAVAYWRATNENGIVELSFICAKTRCAPLKPLTIPRLELQAAVLGARLMKTITEEHSIKADHKTLWSDSSTVINWIRSKHRRYKPFVAHRIAEILSSTEPSNWKWVPTHANTADVATRSSKAVDLTPTSAWLKGPPFLLNPEQNWPSDFSAAHARDDEADDEELPSKYVLAAVSINLIEFNRFSSLSRIVRTVAWVYRFWRRCRRQTNNLEEYGLTSVEIKSAETTLCRLAQQESYSAEFEWIGHQQNIIPKTSPLRKLSPYLDDDGVLRVYGRISAASWLPLETKHPIILPPSHPFTTLVVASTHAKMKHQNTEAVICEVRRKYWVPQLRRLMRKVIGNCLACKIMKAKPVTPLMGSLPADRLSPYVRPFSYTGLDYFGPIAVTVGRRTEKRWVALFTCLTVRAIHLEVAHDLSTDACIMTIRNFINRRGVPVRIRSDNGTNFVGANQEAKRFAEVFDCERIQAELSSSHVEWVFNCPANPSEGGAWERMVQCVKRVLAQTLKEVAPREYTLQCFIVEAENVVNSRPLTHLPVDADQEEPLTPNHFLLGTANTARTPSASEADERLPSLRKQWRVARQLRDRMWKRWVTEYLPTLTRRVKWCQRSQPIKTGDLVFVCDSNIPRRQWCRGRVENVYKGVDGEIRRADVKTSRGTLQRPVSKLAVLDLISESGRSTGVGMLPKTTDVADTTLSRSSMK